MKQYCDILMSEQFFINPLQRRVKSHLPFASIIRRFKVYGSVHRKYIPLYVYIQQDTTLHSLFISGNCSTCFG
jgi:hypothetical protein